MFSISLNRNTMQFVQKVTDLTPGDLNINEYEIDGLPWFSDLS